MDIKVSSSGQRRVGEMNQKAKGEIIAPFRISESEIKSFDNVCLPEGVNAKEVGVDPDLQVFEFKGYASTFGNVDRGADVVEEGAFSDFLAELKESGEMLPALWQHNFDDPIGVYVDMREDAKGLFVHGVLPLDDDFVKGRVIPQMKVGSVRKMSIGYYINDFEWDGENRRLKKLGLWETSLVTVPMNNEANVTEIKNDVDKIGVKDVDAMTVRDMEHALRAVFSRGASKIMVKVLKSDAGREALKDGREANEEPANEGGLKDFLSGLKELNAELRGA